VIPPFEACLYHLARALEALSLAASWCSFVAVLIVFGCLRAPAFVPPFDAKQIATDSPPPDREAVAAIAGSPM
jgi:hypothetical protein